MTDKRKRIVCASVAAVLAAGALAGCGKQTDPIDTANPSITILSKSFNANSASNDSPVVKELEKVLGTKLDLKWAPSATYNEKVVTTMGSGVYPHLMLVDARTSSIVYAARKGIFYDVTDAFTQPDKYPNLAQADSHINHNISIDGRVYGIYRARTVGRAGVTIRKDWLDNLGLEMPTTVDEFYNVLRAFTEDDPDGNGQKDTYGMIVTNYLAGPLYNLAVWMGAPNGWGLDKDGNMAPAFMFDEFMDALKFMRDCYEKGYINQNMSSLPSDKWNEQFLNGYSGVIIDVADRARRVAQNMQEMNPNAVVDVFGYVKKDANSEPRSYPTSGHGGFYVIPSPSVTNEDQLDFMLNVIDKMNGEEATNLMNYGIEGVHYTVDENNYVTVKNDSALKAQYNDLNQISMGLVKYPDGLKTKYTAAVAEKIDQVYEDNEKYAVFDMSEPYVSPTYARRSTQLDSIVSAAELQFIIGSLSEEQYWNEIERWKNMGGNEVIREMNEAYQQDTSIQK